MTLKELLEKYKELIERKLEQYLSFSLNDPRTLLEESMKYSVMAGGKRIRPLLCIASQRLFNSEVEKILPLACAIEYVHTYSLIHDDLPAMDNDDFRRGKPTNHKKYGEDLAILAGDALNTFAFELVCKELPKYYPSERVCKIVVDLGEAWGINGMAGGQVLDLKSSSVDSDEAYLKATHRLKTGAMLKACLVLPAKLEGVADQQIKLLDKYGEHLGLLFQIVDDILDVEGNPEILGKSINKDQDQKKLTYVSLWGLEGAKKAAQEEANQAKEVLTLMNNPHTDVFEDIINYLLTRKS